MAFEQRVNEIKSALQDLVQNLNVADSRVEKFAAELGQGAQGAASYRELADAVKRFSDNLKGVDTGRLTEANNSLRVIQQTLNSLSSTGPAKVTAALEQQARVLREIGQLQGTLRSVGSSSGSPAQQIFQARQQTALDLIQQRHPNADADRARRLAADLAEGIQEDRYRLGNSIRVRTPQLAQELDVLASQKEVVGSKGISYNTSLASFKEQAKAEESASLIAQQAKLEDSTRRRAAELDSLNSIDDDYAAAQKKYTDVIEASARAQKEAQEAAVRQAAASRAAIEENKRLQLLPYQQQYDNLSGTAQRLLGAQRPQFLSGQGDRLTDQDISRLERQAELFQQFDREVRAKSGGQKQLRPEGFTTQSYLDLNSGITKVVGQAQELDGSFITLNGRIDQNGRLAADLGTRYNSLFQTLGKNVVKVAEFAFATELVYGSIRKIGEAFQSVVSVQDELTQLSFTIKELGASSEDFSKRFLQSGIQSGIETGQGFEESIQTQLAAFRLTSGVSDLSERERITKQLTDLQLGSQTAFGLTKEQSIDSVGTIFRQIVDQGTEAGVAVENLRTLFDKFTVAMQNSGVKGSELVQTFAQLVGVSHELNISQNDLVALTAAFSQTTNKSPQETTNAIKILGERIFGEGANDLSDIGISTQEIDPETGKRRNRELVKILQDAYLKSLESETASLQVSQAIGGQRRAPEAAALVRSINVTQQIAETTAGVGEQGGPSGQFENLVKELNKNLIPTLNRLSLVFSQTISKILLDGGLLNDIVDIITTISKALQGLSKIEDPRVFKFIKEGIAAIVLGLGYLGVSQLNIIRNLSASFIRLSESIRSAATAQREFQASQASGNIATAGGGLLAFSTDAGAKTAVRSEVRPFIRPEVLSRIKSAIVGLGATAIPIAFDLTSDVSSAEKYTGIGARIAGGLVGFMVGGPGGALVGQEMAKAFSDAVDLAGLFGTSETEKVKLEKGIQGLNLGQRRELQNATPEDLAALQAYLLAERNKETQQGIQAAGRPFGMYGQQLPAYSIANLPTPQEQESPKLPTGISESTIKAFQKATLGVTPEELVNAIKEFNDAAIQNTIEEFRAGERSPGRPKSAGTSEDNTQLITESVDRTIDRLQKQTDNAIKGLEERYTTPFNQAQFGPGGLQEQGLQSQLLNGQISGEQYNAGIDSLRGLPEILGQAIPLFQDMGISTEGLVQKLYEAGPAGQQSFQQILGPLIEAYTTTREYALLEEQRIQLTATLATLDPDAAAAKSLQEKIALLEQELSLRQASRDVAQSYIDSATPGISSFLQNFSQIQQKATVIKGSKGTPAQFQAPSLFDASDYSIEQISKALDDTREKQAQLVKLFPEYAREFAKQQFVLDNGAGGFKPVAGINQQFFSGFLQQQQKLQKPDIVDLSKYSDTKIGDILTRASQLQGRAIELAPDLAQDAEKSRLLILKKNNDLLSQNGLSQDFLRIAIDELTESNEDMLRGHYNLPSDYRTPTIFDYYDNGGREKGSVNYPTAGGDANLDLAQKIADAIISSQGKIAGQSSDLNALGNTIEPGSAPLGYPNPGSPGTPDRVIPPPPIPNLDQYLPRELPQPDAVDRYLKTSQSGFGEGAKESSGKLRDFQNAVERNQKKLDALETRLEGTSTSVQKSGDAFSTITSLYTGSKATITKFTDGFELFFNKFAPKELGPLVRASFLQGLQQIPPGAIVLNVVLNGQAVPTTQTKVTIGTTGSGGQSLGATSPTQRGRPQ